MITIHSPVIVQITTVSINVPVIVTRPWRAGSFVWAAAAAIGAEPKPASFENIPLATPFCIAKTIAPSIPPAAALKPNAPAIISPNAAGIAFIFTIRIITQTVTYKIAINGTTNSDTVEILFIPPMITSPVQTVTIIPVIITVHEYSIPNILTVLLMLGSKKLFTAEDIPFI